MSLYLFLALSPALGAPLDDRTQFYDRLNKRDFGGMERVLKSWGKKKPEDVEVLVAHGLYFYAKAQNGKRPAEQVPPRKEVLFLIPPSAVKDPPPRSNRLDPQLTQKAADCWAKAIQLYPQRLDVYFQLARLYGETGDFESQNRILGQALLYADKNRSSLKWENNGALPAPLNQCVPEELEGFILGYFQMHRHGEDVKAFRLSKLFLTFFPGNRDGYNFMAAYFSFEGDWPRTLKYLLLARRNHPKNSLILTNIGNTLVKLGKRKEAKIFYKKVIGLNGDPEFVGIAKNRLKSLHSL